MKANQFLALQKAYEHAINSKMADSRRDLLSTARLIITGRLETGETRINEIINQLNSMK